MKSTFVFMVLLMMFCKRAALLVQSCEYIMKDNLSLCPCELNELPWHCQPGVVMVSKAECPKLQFEEQRFRGEPFIDVELHPVPVSCTYNNSVPHGIYIYVVAVIYTSPQDLAIHFQFGREGTDMDVCINFHFGKNYLALPTTFFYREVRVDNDFHDFTFEYEASAGDKKDYRKWFCHLPKTNRIDPCGTKDIDWEVFFCTEKDTNIAIRLMEAPSALNISRYRVNYTENGAKEANSQVLSSKGVSRLSEANFGASCYQNVFISIEPWLDTEGKWGHPSKSILNSSPCPTPLYTYILVAIAVLTGVWLIKWAIWCFCKYFYNQKDVQGDLCLHGSLRKDPGLLLLYTNSSDRHVQVIEKFAYFLEHVLKIKNVLYFERDFKKSELMDPELWFKEVISSVDTILITSSPKPIHESVSVYHTLESIQKRYASICSGVKVIKVQVPYCGEGDFPLAKEDFLPRYHLYKECGPFFASLLKIHPWSAPPSFLCRLLFKVPFSGKELVTAIKDFQTDRELQSELQRNSVDAQQGEVFAPSSGIETIDSDSSDVEDETTNSDMCMRMEKLQPILECCSRSGPEETE